MAERPEDESHRYVDISNGTSDVMWMKMALMAASRAEVTKHAERKPSVGCVIRRSRDRGAPAVLAVGWNGFLPGLTEQQLDRLKAERSKEKQLTADLALHAEANALQYCSEDPLKATVYVTHVPCTACTKQLIARRVRRVYYMYWMDNSETSIDLFKEMGITCTAFGKRKEVLKDFSPDFLTRHGITRGSTEKKIAPENCPCFINLKDRETISSDLRHGSSLHCWLL